MYHIHFSGKGVLKTTIFAIIHPPLTFCQLITKSIAEVLYIAIQYSADFEFYFKFTSHPTTCSELCSYRFPFVQEIPLNYFATQIIIDYKAFLFCAYISIAHVCKPCTTISPFKNFLNHIWATTSWPYWTVGERLYLLTDCTKQVFWLPRVPCEIIALLRSAARLDSVQASVGTGTKSLFSAAAFHTRSFFL